MKKKKQPTIILYSGPGCRYCKLAKEYFEREGLTFTEHDVSKEPEAREKVLSLGTRSIPVIIIDDTPVVGFDEQFIADRIKKATT